MEPTYVRRMVSVVIPLLVVGLTVAVLVALDADLTVAALCLVPVVVGCALLGPLAGVLGALAAFLATNYFFTAPRKSFSIDKTQDLVALVAFGVAAGGGQPDGGARQRAPPARAGVRP